MKYGVTGASGQLGRLVITHLPKEDTIALVRNPEKVSAPGVKARAFDYENADANVLKGIDTLLLISGNAIGQRTQQHKNVIEAAKAAGVKHIIYTSLLKADKSGLMLAKEHLETEALIAESNIPYTILRNGWYTENYTGSVQPAIQMGKLVGSAGAGKISGATRADYAEAAAKVILHPELQGKVYELAGDEAFTLEELAAEISIQTHKTIPYEDLSVEEHAKALAQGGMPEQFAQVFASFDQGAKNGDLYYDGKELSKLIGRPTTSLSDAVTKALNA